MNIKVQRYSTSEVQDLTGIVLDWITGVGRTGDVETG